MSLFGKRTAGLLDVIRCDEPDYLIWKWHPKGTDLGSNTRENAIRWGSSLRVKDGEVAVFVYHQNGEAGQDFIKGPFDEILETENLPVLASIVGLAYGGGTPFQAEIYFINLAQIIQLKFGVPYFDVYDPRVVDFGVPVAVRGTLTFSIRDYREFIKLHRLNSFNLDNFQSQVRDAIARYVKDAVANAPAAHNIPLVQIETKTAQITDAVEYDVGERLKENFGVTVSGLDIGAIELDKTSEGYAQLMAVTKGVVASKIDAETKDYAERLRIQREEAQYAQRKQTQTAHLGAFQTEKQAEVGMAGAEALGKMGASGAGSVDLSGGSVGFNPAAMMAGMAIGGAVGQNVAGAMSSIIAGVNSPAQAGVAPPPIPAAAYHVAINGQATGPYDITVLAGMASTGRFSADTLVWKAGMPQWTRAGMIDELKAVFVNIPPTPPNE